MLICENCGVCGIEDNVIKDNGQALCQQCFEDKMSIEMAEAMIAISKTSKKEIEVLINDLEIQKNELEKFEMYSDFDRGLFKGNINLIESIVNRLKKITK